MISSVGIELEVEKSPQGGISEGRRKSTDSFLRKGPKEVEESPVSHMPS